MDAVTRFSRAVVAELKERRADPVGFAAREERRARGEVMTLVVTRYIEDQACIEHVFQGRTISTEWFTHAAAEDKALEIIERRDLMEIIERDMTGGK